MTVKRNYFLSSFIILLFIFLPSTIGFAQEKSKSEKSVARKQKKQDKIAEGKFLILPLAGPAYTPELGFTIAGSVMMSYKTNPTDTLIQRSSSPVTIGITSTGAFFVGTKITSFWFRDTWRMYADINYKVMPDNYYGIGYDAGLNTPRGDSTTGYTRTWFQFYPKFLYQFKTNHFIGPFVDINYTQGSEASPGVADDAYYQEFNDKPFNVGFGAVYQFDSRDIPVNAYKGWFLEATAGIYGTYLGGDNNYEMIGFDYRHYFPIKQLGHTLAIQVRGRWTTGDVPYGELSQLGTPFDLRGYRWGQYRGESMTYAIAEYRHTFNKRDGELGKIGAVGWIAAGTLGETVGDFNKWLPNLGIGFRYEVQPRMNLRLDFGIGKETTGFYFNFNEAF